MRADETTDATAVVSAAAGGVFSLLMRFGALQAVNFLASIVLSRLLFPDEYGVFAIITAVTSILSTVGGAGLSAAVIQRREEPTAAQLSSLFWLQLAASSLLFTVLFALSQFISDSFALSGSGAWLVRAAAVSLLMDSVRSVPSATLERRLNYGPVAMVEVSEGVAFQLVAVACAWLGFGVWALILALTASRVVGVGALLRVTDWRPIRAFDRAFVTTALHFGIRYQVPTLISRLKDTFNPIVVGLLVGTAGAGFIAWASALAFLPLPIMSTLWRVSFPALSRMQNRRDHLDLGVSLSIRAASATALPISMISLALAYPITTLVFDPKWVPALPSFYLLAISLWPAAVIGFPLLSMFGAIGRPDISLRFTILYAVLEWTLGIPLVLWLGFAGVAVRSVIVAYGTLPLLLAAAKPFVSISLRNVFFPYFLRSVAAAAVSWAISVAAPLSYPTLLASGGAGVAVYLALSLRPIIRDLQPVLSERQRRWIERRATRVDWLLSNMRTGSGG